MRRSHFLHFLLLMTAWAVATSTRSGTALKAAGERVETAQEADDDGLKKHHHHNHRHHHRHHHKHQGKHAAESAEAAAAAKVPNSTEVKAEPAVQAAVSPATPKSTEASEQAIIMKMRKLEKDISNTQTSVLRVNAPLPEHFAELFARSVAKATGCDAKRVTVVDTSKLEKGKIVSIGFRATPDVVKAILEQAADGESKLAKGELCPLLVARAADGSLNGQCDGTTTKDEKASVKDGAMAMLSSKDLVAKPEAPSQPTAEEPQSPEVSPSVEHDLDMPYGDLEPFGREDTAQELTEDSIKETDEMVDQLERAEVAEEKRAVFRALTRLRGAAITSFDGIARAQTSSIDEYNKAHQWRQGHPVQHLANEESDISKWAFPDASL